MCLPRLLGKQVNKCHANYQEFDTYQTFKENKDIPCIDFIFKKTMLCVMDSSTIFIILECTYDNDSKP